MILQKLTVREQKIFYVVIVLLVVVGSYHGAWIPARAKFSAVDEEIFALQMRIRKARTYLQQRNEIMDEAKKYQNLEQMDAGKDEEEIARLLSLIERTARKTDVALSDVKPQQVKTDKISKRFIVELNAESGLQQLVDFIYQLQHSEQMLKIERVDSSPKEEQSAILMSSLPASIFEKSRMSFMSSSRCLPLSRMKLT